MKIGILLFLFVGFRILFSEMELMSELTKTLRKTRSEMNAASRQRNLADRQNLLKMQERHSFWYPETHKEKQQNKVINLIQH